MESNCCGALMVEIDEDGLGLCSECKEWAYDEEEDVEEEDEDIEEEDEDVNYEAAKDLDEDRMRGIRARCN